MSFIIYAIRATRYLSINNLRMKKIILICTLFTLVVAACRQQDKKASSLLNKNNLLAQLFTVDINKDTTLKTANGAFIHIPEGALSNSGNTMVQLEIKEAYSMEQILMAGLSTQSNGWPLSSGGMIYINAMGGQSVTITKKLSIKIPTAAIDKNMQLYKGDTDKNGNINWTKPENLPPNPLLDSFAIGRSLFTENCNACHNIGKDGVGPDLAYILTKTPDKKLLYDYTRNNVKVRASGEPYYNCLFENRNGTEMSLFPALTDPMMDNLYGYIENESRAKNLPFTKNELRACVDSNLLYWSLKYKLDSQKGKLSQEKVAMIINDIVSPALPATSDSSQPGSASIPENKKVIPVQNRSLYYQFTVQAFGWFNIDMLLKEKNVTDSRLVVRILGQYTQTTNVYVAIPSLKFFAPGGLLDGKTDEYGFYTTDGKIPLPQNTLAFVFVIGESEESIVFSKKAFITSESQDIDLTPAIVTKDFFAGAMKEVNSSNVQFSVADTKNADTLRKIIKALKDIEKIKPKNNCNCGGEGFARHDTLMQERPVLTDASK